MTRRGWNDRFPATRLRRTDDAKTSTIRAAHTPGEGGSRATCVRREKTARGGGRESSRKFCSSVPKIDFGKLRPRSKYRRGKQKPGPCATGESEIERGGCGGGRLRKAENREVSVFRLSLRLRLTLVSGPKANETTTTTSVNEVYPTRVYPPLPPPPLSLSSPRLNSRNFRSKSAARRLDFLHTLDWYFSQTILACAGASVSVGLSLNAENPKADSWSWSRGIRRAKNLRPFRTEEADVVSDF